MALDKQAILEHVFGITPYVDDWYIGLYYDGSDPVTDIATAEVDGMRTTFIAAFDTDHITNSSQVLIGPLPSGSIGGIFVVNGLTATDIDWSGPFDGGPITANIGDYISIAANALSIQIN